MQISDMFTRVQRLKNDDSLENACGIQKDYVSHSALGWLWANDYEKCNRNHIAEFLRILYNERVIYNDKRVGVYVSEAFSRVYFS